MADTAQPAPAPVPAKPEAEAEEPKSVEQTAEEYVIPLSPEAADKWQGKEEAFTEYAKQMASGLYPALAPQIAQGITVKTLLEPYVQIAKSVLGPDTEPDWNDPRWGRVLDGGTDPKSGRPTLMSPSEFKSYLTHEPSFGFDQSTAANTRAQGFAQALNSSFSGEQGGELGS